MAVKVGTAAAQLAEPLSGWTARAVAGAPGLTTVIVVNLSTLGVVSGAKLGWSADFVTTALHNNPTHSAALLIQTNRSFDELIKEEQPGSESDASESDSEAGFGRVGKPSNVRSQRMKVTEIFMEGRRKLNVLDVTLIFDPETCWGSRKGAHEALLITARGLSLRSSAMLPCQ